MKLTNLQLKYYLMLSFLRLSLKYVAGKMCVLEFKPIPVTHKLFHIEFQVTTSSLLVTTQIIITRVEIDMAVTSP